MNYNGGWVSSMVILSARSVRGFSKDRACGQNHGTTMDWLCMFNATEGKLACMSPRTESGSHGAVTLDCSVSQCVKSTQHTARSCPGPPEQSLGCPWQAGRLEDGQYKCVPEEHPIEAVMAADGSELKKVAASVSELPCWLQLLTHVKPCRRLRWSLVHGTAPGRNPAWSACTIGPRWRAARPGIARG
jgi:hypothetical protein